MMKKNQRGTVALIKQEKSAFKTLFLQDPRNMVKAELLKLQSHDESVHPSDYNAYNSESQR